MRCPCARLYFLDRDSTVNVEGLGSLPTVRLERRLGMLFVDTKRQVRNALAYALEF